VHKCFSIAIIEIYSSRWTLYCMKRNLLFAIETLDYMAYIAALFVTHLIHFCAQCNRFAFDITVMLGFSHFHWARQRRDIRHKPRLRLLCHTIPIALNSDTKFGRWVYIHEQRLFAQWDACNRRNTNIYYLLENYKQRRRKKFFVW